MLHRIKDFIETYGIIEKGDHIIVGVSGGIDSVSLLMILKELSGQMGFSLEALHVEHGIRGTESIQDAEFTMDLCRRLDIGCQMVSVDVPAYAKKEHLGDEEAARGLRYAAFAKRAKQCGEHAKIALAHHMEDNAETMLFQLARGSGLRGLCGIAPMRRDADGVVYIRPLLCVQKKELEFYLKELGQSYCTDATNELLVYSRNRIRHVVIPELEKLNEQTVCHLNQSAGQLAMVWDYMQKQSADELERVILAENPLTVSAELLSGLHPALRSMAGHELIARAAGKKKDITSKHVEELLNLAGAESGKQIVLPYGIEVRKEYDRMIFRKKSQENLEKNEGPGSIFIAREKLEQLNPGEVFEVDLKENDSKIFFRKFNFDGNMDKIPKKKCTKWMDYDKIKNSFQVRTRKAGDYFVNDVQGHRKKLKQYFIDEKIPASQRNRIWLVANADEIVWITGGRMSETYRISKQTQVVLELEYIEGR